MGIIEEKGTKGVLKCIQDMYEGTSTKVRSLYRETEDLMIRVGVIVLQIYSFLFF